MSNPYGPLFDGLDKDQTLAAKARIWMDKHPEAMRLYEDLALKASARGRRFGISFLTERIRWEYRIERDDNAFKIDNNHRAYIARELIKRHPELTGLLELREAGA